MRISWFLLAGLLVVSLFNESCKNEDSEPCSYPHLVTVNSECYSGNGLQLTAGDYGDKPLSFEWNIYALKDTSQLLGWTPKDEKLRMIASTSFVVPDSLVANYQRLIVNVAANCGGQLKQSIYYSFIKRKSVSTNCVTWVAQNQ